MQFYVARRLLLMIPTLLGVTFIVFVMVRAVPGDVIDLLTGDFGAASEETKEALRKEYQLDDNIVVQYVKWIGRVARFDFGNSILSDRTVISELKSRLPVTLELGILAIICSLCIALPVGIMSAIRQDTAWDYAGRSFAIGLLAIPGFWVGIILITMAGRYFTWGVPPKDYIAFTDNPLGNLRMMIVPSMILGAGLSGSVMRFTRSAMLETLRQDYIRTAQAKGLRPRQVVGVHALRNALLPIVTVIGPSLAFLVTGSFVVESLFAIPGVGYLGVQAIAQRDYPVIMGTTVILAVAVVIMNLVTDILYTVLDPRIKAEG